MDLSIGDRVFYTRSNGLHVPVKVVGRLHDDHVELTNDRGGVLSRESAPMEVGAPAGTSEGPEAVESTPTHPKCPRVPTCSPTPLVRISVDSIEPGIICGDVDVLKTIYAPKYALSLFLSLSLFGVFF